MVCKKKSLELQMAPENMETKTVSDKSTYTGFCIAASPLQRLLGANPFMGNEPA